MGLSKSFSVHQVFCNMDYVNSFAFDLPRMAEVPLFDRKRRPYWTQSLHGTTDVSDPEVIPSLLCGEWIPDELLGRFPGTLKAVRVRAQSKSRPGIKQDVLHGFLLVSEECRTVIKAVEPDRHQFIPVTLEALNAETFRFFYFNCMNWIPTSELYDLSEANDADVKSVEVANKLRDAKFTALRIRRNATPPLWKRHFSDAAIVIEGVQALECQPPAVNERRNYCRHEFIEKFKAKNLRGLRFSEACILK